jgi:hypothetical protein
MQQAHLISRLIRQRHQGTAGRSRVAPGHRQYGVRLPMRGRIGIWPIDRTAEECRTASPAATCYPRIAVRYGVMTIDMRVCPVPDDLFTAGASQSTMPENRAKVSPGQVILGVGVKLTLRGFRRPRYVDVFSPAEASCRECRRRWALAGGVSAR